MSVNSDFRDLLSEFDAGDVRHLVVGAYAVFFYAEPRYTKDLDVWVEATPQNAARVFASLTRFGAPMSEVRVEDFSVPGITFQIGVPPNRIDILTEVTGVDFPGAWGRKCEGRYGDQRIWLIGLDDLVRNKRAVDRPQDREDLKRLEAAQRARR